jgi:hypothetical protein
MVIVALWVLHVTRVLMGRQSTMANAPERATRGAGNQVVEVVTDGASQGRLVRTEIVAPLGRRAIHAHMALKPTMTTAHSKVI